MSISLSPDVSSRPIRDFSSRLTPDVSGRLTPDFSRRLTSGCFEPPYPGFCFTPDVSSHLTQNSLRRLTLGCFTALTKRRVPEESPERKSEKRVRKGRPRRQEEESERRFRDESGKKSCKRFQGGSNRDSEGVVRKEVRKR